LWFVSELRLWGKRPFLSDQEMYVRNRLVEYTPKYWIEKLIPGYKNTSITLRWSWNSFGAMIFYKSMDRRIHPPVDYVCLQIMWFIILLDFRHNELKAK
jgi:hypothetical protein